MGGTARKSTVEYMGPGGDAVTDLADELRPSANSGGTQVKLGGASLKSTVGYMGPGGDATTDLADVTPESKIHPKQPTSF